MWLKNSHNFMTKPNENCDWQKQSHTITIMTPFMIALDSSTNFFVTANNSYNFWTNIWLSIMTHLWMLETVTSLIFVIVQNSHKWVLWLPLIVGLESHNFAGCDCYVNVFSSHKKTCDWCLYDCRLWLFLAFVTVFGSHKSLILV